MSANNWRTCPQCVKEQATERAAKIEAAHDKYGKIPPDEFRSLIADAEKPVEHKVTLREDYEQGIDDDGEYYVHFQASCQVCNFRFRFSHTEMTLPSDEADQ